jgi:hypothetical protein
MGWGFPTTNRLRLPSANYAVRQDGFHLNAAAGLIILRWLWYALG